MAFADFTKHPARYVKVRGLLLWHLLFSLPGLRRKTRENTGWKELFESLNSFHDDFFRCLQVPDEIVAAMEIIERHAPRRILEIGTARGGTLFLFSRAAAPDAFLVSLDLAHGKYGGGYSAWKTHIFRRLLRDGQRAEFVRGDSHEAASLDEVCQHFKGEKLDLLFIDGDHTYAGVKQDYELYSPLVREGGLIILHDIAKHPPQLQCEVDRFWNEVKGCFQSQEVIADRQQGWAGIGILNYSQAGLKSTAATQRLGQSG